MNEPWQIAILGSPRGDKITFLLIAQAIETNRDPLPITPTVLGSNLDWHSADGTRVQRTMTNERQRNSFLSVTLLINVEINSLNKSMQTIDVTRDAFSDVTNCDKRTVNRHARVRKRRRATTPSSKTQPRDERAINLPAS